MNAGRIGGRGSRGNLVEEEGFRSVIVKINHIQFIFCVWHGYRLSLFFPNKKIMLIMITIKYPFSVS